MAKFYETKSALTAADMLNDRVLPFFESQEVPLLRILTDRGSEYCGNVEHHEYQLYLAIENIDHTRTKTKSPQTNGICERFHRTMLEEFYQIAFRKKLTPVLSSCNRMSMIGLIPTIALDPIQVDAAMARPQCRPSSIANDW